MRVQDCCSACAGRSSNCALAHAHAARKSPTCAPQLQKLCQVLLLTSDCSGCMQARTCLVRCSSAPVVEQNRKDTHKDTGKHMSSAVDRNQQAQQRASCALAKRRVRGSQRWSTGLGQGEPVMRVKRYLVADPHKRLRSSAACMRSFSRDMSHHCPGAWGCSEEGVPALLLLVHPLLCALHVTVCGAVS